MKKTAKIISLVVSIAMVLSVVFTIAINVSAADTTAFNVAAAKEDGKVTLTVNLKSGGFNAIDAQFDMSEGVTCESIKQGATWKEFKNEQEDNGSPAVFTANTENGKIGAATATTFDKAGDFVVAVFNVDDDSEFSITFKVDSCKVTEGEAENEVTPSIENATYKYVPDSATPTDADPTEPVTDPSEPVTDPTEPATPTDADPTEPVTEEPTTEEPATEEPTTEEPVTEEPTTEEPVTEEPTTEEPVTEEPTTEEPVTEEPTTEEPVTEEPTTAAPVDDETTTIIEEDTDDSAVKPDADEDSKVPATGTEKESPNTGSTSSIVVGAIVTAISGAAVALVLRRKNEVDE